MILLTLAGSTIGNWVRRAMLAVTRPPPAQHSNRDVPPPEYYRFPIF